MWNPDIYSEPVYNEFMNTGIREMIERAVFEDGKYNDAINCPELYSMKNEMAVIKGLSEIAHDAVSNNKWHLLSGTLRVVAWITIESSKDRYVAHIFGFAREALMSNSSEAQESAVMLFEEWRTKLCYELLCSVKFNSQWLSEYAANVIEELRREI